MLILPRFQVDHFQKYVCLCVCELNGVGAKCSVPRGQKEIQYYCFKTRLEGCQTNFVSPLLNHCTFIKQLFNLLTLIYAVLDKFCVTNILLPSLILKLLTLKRARKQQVYHGLANYHQPMVPHVAKVSCCRQWLLFDDTALVQHSCQPLLAEGPIHVTFNFSTRMQEYLTFSNEGQTHF